MQSDRSATGLQIDACIPLVTLRCHAIGHNRQCGDTIHRPCLLLSPESTSASDVAAVAKSPEAKLGKRLADSLPAPENQGLRSVPFVRRCVPFGKRGRFGSNTESMTHT